MGKFVQALPVSEVDSDKPVCVEVQGKELAIFKKDGSYYALDNVCTHQGGPLCEGEVEDGQVECPWHGARFDITTGAVTGPPAPQDVTSHSVRVKDGNLEVEIE